ncbi:tubby-like F-box protein 5 [Arachis hypogaea]|uniref:tubby-like F-box protein 5 n=1 Tax=Arachis hypogaea TaxID=3818 RepID=UPI003B226FD6
MKPFLLLNHPDPVFNCEQVNSTHSMAHAPFPYSEPFFGGSLVAYGLQAVLGPRDGIIQCFIKRDKSNSTYHIFLCLSPGIGSRK